MGSKRDYYEVLGVDKSASDADIKRAYRKLAAQYHPDVNHEAGAEERFKEINEANEVLSDSEKRGRYDQFGHAGIDPNFGGDGGFGGGFGDFGDLGDLFGSFFGGGARTSRRSANSPMRGEDVSARVELRFEEAAFGTQKEVTSARIENCDHCHGTGAEVGTKVETCPRCHGMGSVRTTQSFMGMSMQSSTTCPECRGTGKNIKNPCPRCKGKGKVRRSNKTTVKIPAGIDDGQTLRVSGEGSAGANGGPSGDLLVGVRVRPHPLFTRQQQSVYCEMPISFTQAACGADLEVPTLDGKVRYPVPEGTQTGTTFRLKGKGIPYLNGKGRGDQFVTVVVETPTALSSEQKELLRQFEAGGSEKSQPKRKKFGAKLKEAFEGK
ncbi:MAG: molecular chaperone DnaJ [Oscillospiraceae bacterium]|jgi:molecular chaperone DnaJ|nr:molecular chaperone DnaJ [Oscillospiraceae bacterium]